MLSRTLLVACLLIPACTARPDEVDTLLQDSIDDLATHLARVDDSMQVMREEQSVAARHFREDTHASLTQLSELIEEATERGQIEAALRSLKREVAATRSELERAIERDGKSRGQVSQLRRALALSEHKHERDRKTLRAAVKKLRGYESSYSKLQRALSHEQRQRRSAEQRAKAAANLRCRCTHQRNGSSSSRRTRRRAVSSG